MRGPVCLVINLATETGRKASMSERLARLDIRPIWINAVDGRGARGAALLTAADTQRAAACYGAMTATEVACAASHVQAYGKIVEMGAPMALILEDDMALDDDVTALLEALGSGAMSGHMSPSVPAVIHLTHVARAWRWGTYPLGARKLARAAGPVWLTGAYVVTQEAARRLHCSRQPVWTVADHWEAIAKDAGLTLYAISPPCAYEAAEAAQSSIATQAGPRRIAPRRTFGRAIIHSMYRNLLRPLLTQRLPRRRQ